MTIMNILLSLFTPNEFNLALMLVTMTILWLQVSCYLRRAYKINDTYHELLEEKLKEALKELAK